MSLFRCLIKGFLEKNLNSLNLRLFRLVKQYILNGETIFLVQISVGPALFLEVINFIFLSLECRGVGT